MSKKYNSINEAIDALVSLYDDCPPCTESSKSESETGIDMDSLYNSCIGTQTYPLTSGDISGEYSFAVGNGTTIVDPNINIGYLDSTGGTFQQFTINSFDSGIGYKYFNYDHIALSKSLIYINDSTIKIEDFKPITITVDMTNKRFVKIRLNYEDSIVEYIKTFKYAELVSYKDNLGNVWDIKDSEYEFNFLNLQCNCNHNSLNIVPGSTFTLEMQYRLIKEKNLIILSF